MEVDSKSPWAVAAAEKLSMADYHADFAPDPSLTHSIANILLKRSPRHAWLAHPRLNPNYVREEDSRFDLGTAVHSMLLERDESPIVWCPFDDWRTKAAKEMRDAARLAHKLPVLTHYRSTLMQMVQTAGEFIEASEFAGILDTGTPEQSITWKQDGIYCRARPDLISADRKVILDYKSTDNAEPEAFIRQISRLGYDVQAEFYVQGVGETLRTAPFFVFLAQEIDAPYACSLVALSEAYRALGQAKVKWAMERWAVCLQCNEWPSYRSAVHYAEPPGWELSALETADAP